jgi:hypothetical protein
VCCRSTWDPIFRTLYNNKANFYSTAIYIYIYIYIYIKYRFLIRINKRSFISVLRDGFRQIMSL